MKITFNLYLSEVVNLLCVAATYDSTLLEQNLNKHGIMNICTGTIRRVGMERDGWADELSDYEELVIHNWADAQTRKYKW